MSPPATIIIISRGLASGIDAVFLHRRPNPSSRGGAPVDCVKRGYHAKKKKKKKPLKTMVFAMI
jgi:hypothetical protein